MLIKINTLKKEHNNNNTINILYDIQKIKNDNKIKSTILSNDTRISHIKK